MKVLFILLGSVLFLGTFLSLHLIQEAWFFLPLYILAIYFLYRVNYSEGFFVVFQNKEEKEASAKIRLGPVEIGPKDEGDRKEEKFIELFDWKRSTIRNLLSLMLIGGAIWLYFLRLKMDINLQTVMSMIIVFLVMRSISVGHLLVPLMASLFVVTSEFPDYSTPERGLMLLYGILFVFLMALIYPSEDKLGKKLKDWMTRKWMDIIRTTFIVVVAFAAGLYVLPEKFEKKPPVTSEKIEAKQKELRKLESSLRAMERMGLMRRPDLEEEARYLSRDLQKFSRKEDREESLWNELQKRQKALDQEVAYARISSPAPRLSQELIDQMRADLEGQSRVEADPLLQAKLEQLIRKLENYNGTGGSDIVAEYREMKFGNQGYYREETEFQEKGSMTSQTAEAIREMKMASEKKKELVEKLDKNIEELKASSEEGLLSVNKALKDELEAVDSLSAEEKSIMEKELSNSRRSLEELAAKTKNQALKENIDELIRKNDRLKNEITPHMRAETKSELAKNILAEKQTLQEITKDVRKEILSGLKKEQKLSEEDKNEKMDFSGLIRGLIIAAGGILVFWFLSRFKKKGIEKVRGIPEELKEEMEGKLREVKRKRLSPREEVIETYNILHDGLSGLVFTNQTPPSCIVYAGMSAAEPELTKPLFTVTETFATTFYGNYDVTNPMLKNFRKDITKVFSFFDIRP